MTFSWVRAGDADGLACSREEANGVSLARWSDRVRPGTGADDCR